MVYLHADHIITPLGDGIETNLSSIREGRSELRQHSIVHGEKLVIPVMASLLDDNIYLREGYTWFESLCIQAVSGAIANNPIDVAGKRCVFILASTKGEIWYSMADTASHIARFFGNTAPPIVVSTACTSGVSAQILAWNLIESQQYDQVVVVGCDIQREFIVSGFQCFHALSEELCMPFDENRKGLNAGEAVACMIFSNTKSKYEWQLLGGSIHNDANHISGPSRTAEGSLRCLQDTLNMVDKEDLACVSVHGTGTLYNDEMESIAIQRAELQDIPVSALKGVYGHTMGAAGLLETILSLHALEVGEILPTKGFNKQGTSFAVDVDSKLRYTTQKSLIKLLSGFGGVNAAVAWSLKGPECYKQPEMTNLSAWNPISSIHIDSQTNLLTRYKEMKLNYPKFYKMDLLCKLGFISVESLLEKLKQQSNFCLSSEKTAIILANHFASLKNDTDYQNTIKDKSNYYPSPSLFVYTLPNIVTGELAIRNKIYGETSCYILNNIEDLRIIKQTMLQCSPAEQLVIGWVECAGENEYNAYVELLIKK